jgi:hypothetical protein
MAAKKTKRAATMKPSAAKRTLNAGKKTKPTKGAPFNEQDPKRRLGDFVGAGEHARQR